MYKKSGVNLDEAENLNKKLSLNLKSKNFGMFAGGSYINELGLKIVHCCDGIGSKIIPLYEHKMYKTIAIDLIAANLNDLATCDAKAVLFSDYIAVNSLDSNAISTIIIELENELSKYDCELAGGETSEIPHLLRENTIDICGFAIGLSKEKVAREVCKNDIIIGLSSNGIHANGFTLLRKLFADKILSEEEFQDCLKPSFVYYNAVRKLWDKNLIKSGANITGGGILSNLNRVLPSGFKADLYYKSIPEQNIFQKLELVVGDEIWNVFNCGVGFCIITDKKNVNEVLEITKEFNPFIFGEVISDD